jgi:PIN domain nuclease of toxin-antitoxin system
VGGDSEVIVLDTSAWLWWLHDPGRLSAPARVAIAQAAERSTALVCAISVWEVAVKAAAGKLSLALGVAEWYEKARLYPGITIEPLDPVDSIAGALLPGEFHRDPADRIIVALARRHHARLVTADPRIRAYPHVTCVW